MIFGQSALCADEFSLAFTPTNANAINYVELKNADFDDLYATQNVSEEMSFDIPDNWDFDYILRARYNNDALAGEIDFFLDTISHLAIKRKRDYDFTWTTIAVQEVNTIDDLNFSGIDITPGTGKYQYAVVPVLDRNEGNYSVIDVDITMEQLVIADSTAVWATHFTDGFCDVTCVVPNTVLETMYDKYPTIVSNGNANYQTITVNAEFYPITDEDGNCDPTLMDDDATRIKYIRELLAFLTNKKTKVLKNVDGRRWLVWVTTPPTDAADTYYKTRKITFGCTEIGDVDSSEDLYNAGITDVTEEWW